MPGRCAKVTSVTGLERWLSANPGHQLQGRIECGKIVGCLLELRCPFCGEYSSLCYSFFLPW
jgi:hypothetical protein